MSRLSQQLEFLVEIDGLKEILRRSWRISGQAKENSAEHSWHLVMAALVLHEHANEPVDLARVLKMTALHDIVEIDAGDTFVYDEAARTEKAEREQEAATRIFGLLPSEQGAALRALWDEFEAGDTAEARFARTLDRLLPLLHNFHAEGRTWKEHGVVADQVRALHAPTRQGSEALGEFIHELIEESVRRGYLLEAAD